MGQVCREGIAGSDARFEMPAARASWHCWSSNSVPACPGIPLCFILTALTLDSVVSSHLDIDDYVITNYAPHPSARLHPQFTLPTHQPLPTDCHTLCGWWLSRWVGGTFCDTVANHPGFTWTVQELAHSVQCPEKGRLCPGIFLKCPNTIQFQSVKKNAVL